jgi:hypothetical protein
VIKECRKVIFIANLRLVFLILFFGFSYRIFLSPCSRTTLAAPAHMPPAKSSKTGHEDSKADVANPKERNGHVSANNHSNGKLRRVASSSGTQIRDTAIASANPPPTQPATSEPVIAGVRQTTAFPSFWIGC